VKKNDPLYLLNSNLFTAVTFFHCGVGSVHALLVWFQSV